MPRTRLIVSRGVLLNCKQKLFILKIALDHPDAQFPKLYMVYWEECLSSFLLYSTRLCIPFTNKPIRGAAWHSWVRICDETSREWHRFLLFPISPFHFKHVVNQQKKPCVINNINYDWILFRWIAPVNMSVTDEKEKSSCKSSEWLNFTEAQLTPACVIHDLITIARL